MFVCARPLANLECVGSPCGMGQIIVHAGKHETGEPCRRPIGRLVLHASRGRVVGGWLFICSLVAGGPPEVVQRGEPTTPRPLGTRARARVCPPISLPAHGSRSLLGPSQTDFVPRPCLCATEYVTGYAVLWRTSTSPHHTTTTPPPRRCHGIRIFALPWCVCPPAASSSSFGIPPPHLLPRPAPVSGLNLGVAP